MQNLDAVCQWLKSWPAWEPEARLYINQTDMIPGNCGLFPGGQEEIGRKEDVLGNVHIRYRCRFTLYRVTGRDGDSMADALWAQQLQAWVREQQRLGLTPVFGDVPREESIRAEKGRLVKVRQPANRLYAVEFTAEFTKNYEVIE